MSQRNERPEILKQFRDSWLHGALPLVVEHGAEAELSICAAPSLWMRARELARSRAAPATPWREATVDTPGETFVSELVAALRQGQALVPARGVPNALSRAGAACVPGVARCGASFEIWEAARWRTDLERRFGPLTAWTGRVVAVAGAWTAPAVQEATMLALVGSAELHVFHSGVIPAQIDGESPDWVAHAPDLAQIQSGQISKVEVKRR